MMGQGGQFGLREELNVKVKWDLGKERKGR